MKNLLKILEQNKDKIFVLIAIILIAIFARDSIFCIIERSFKYSLSKGATFNPKLNSS